MRDKILRRLDVIEQASREEIQAARATLKLVGEGEPGGAQRLT
jgi:hypothetical protein